MTKSKLVGRGGSRAGAGRKPKPVAGPTHVATAHHGDGDREKNGAQSEPIIPAGLSVDERRKFLQDLSDETLATVMVTGTSESARVAAAREMNDRTRGKPKPGTAANPDQNDLFVDDGWGGLLDARQPAAGRTN